MMSRFHAAFLAATLFSVISRAQVSPPVSTSGIAPFSLESHAGGGIDSINLGNLGIMLSIPINSNGVYGPKSSAVLVDESGFQLLSYVNKLWFNGSAGGFYLPATAATPAYMNINNSGQTCEGTFYGAIDATGAFHPTPTVTVSSCLQIYVSAPGHDSWQVATLGGLYFWAISPNGTYSTFNPTNLYYANSGTVVLSTVDLHNNSTTYTDYKPAGETNWVSGQQSWSDAAGNLTATTAIPANQGINPPMYLQYPGPGGTTPQHIFNWSAYMIDGDANCSSYHGWLGSAPWPEQLPSEITLPDYSTYQFSYEQYWLNQSYYTGRIGSVKLPTGGLITYQYSGGTNGNGVWCDDASGATIKKITPDGTWTFTHCEYGLATAPLTCNTSAPSGWANNHIATTTVTAPSGDYKIYTTAHAATDPLQMLILPVQEQSFDVSSPGCSQSAPCNLGSQVVCYNGASYPSCASPSSVPDWAITERDVYTLVPGVTNPSLTVYLADSYGRTTEVRVYDFGGAKGQSNWDTKTDIAYGSWNGSACTTLTNTISATIDSNQYTATYQVMNRVCSKSLYVGGNSTTAVSTSYYTYNATGDLVTQQDTIGGKLVTTAQNSYDGFGRLTKSVGPNGETTSTQYTGCSNQEPSSTTVTTGYSTSLTTNYTSYDCTGERLLTKQDANGNNWSTSYGTDPFWRPMSTTDGMNNTTNYSYPTPTTKNVSLTVATGSVEDTLTQVDSMGRLQLTEAMLNGTSNYSITKTTYDSNGRVQSRSVPYTAAAGTLTNSAGAFTYTYDGLDRILTEVGPAYSSTIPGTTRTYTYTANDTLVTISPAPSGENVKSTQIEVNGLGELTSACEVTTITGNYSCKQANSENGFATTYSYYPGRKLQKITQNAYGTTTQVRSFTYDNSNTGRMLTSTTPESGTFTTTYDSDPSGYCSSFTGFPVKTVDNGGGTTCMSYDLADRVVGRTYPKGLNSGVTPSKTFIYDSTTNSHIFCTTPNQAGAVAEAYTGPANNKITDEGFCYDADGRPNGAYEWTSTSSWGWASDGETYFPDGQVSELSLPPGVGVDMVDMVIYSLDANGRKTSAIAYPVPNPSGAASNIADGTTLLSSVTYLDNGLPNVITLGSGDTSTYTPYSNLQPQTVTHTIGSGTNNTITHTLTWNSNGTLQNLTTSDLPNPANSQSCTFSHDDLERTITNNCGANWNESYSYDPFGNVTKSGSAPWPISGSYNQSNNQYSSSAFVYDANGRLTNDTFDTLAWDVNGNLISQSGTSFVYDAFNRPVMGGSTQYFYAPDASLVSTSQGNVFIPLPMSRAVYVAGLLSHYDRKDWQGSIRVASTQSATLYSDTSYDAFGIPYWTSGTINNQYAGLSSDVSSGGEQVSMTRRYHPTQGRWLSPDSWGLAFVDMANPQSFNRYAYVGNNPLMRIDPKGQECWPPSACGQILINWGSQILNSVNFVTTMTNSSFLSVAAIPAKVGGNVLTTVGQGLTVGQSTGAAWDSGDSYTLTLALADDMGKVGSDILMLAPAGQALNSTLAPVADTALSLSPAADAPLAGVSPAADTSQVGVGTGAATRSGVNGIGPSQGYFPPPTTNAVGGNVYTSIGEVSGPQVGTVVNSALVGDENPISVITGAHGAANGSWVADSEMYQADLNAYGNQPTVTVYNFPDMSPGEINSLLNGPGTTICGFCNTGAVMEPYWNLDTGEIVWPSEQ